MTSPHSRALKHQIDANVGARIRHRRVECGLSQQALSSAIGVSYQQIQKYERGTNRIGASTLWLLCFALNVDVAYFFSELDHEHSSKGRATSSLSDSQKDLVDARETLELVKAYVSIEDSRLRTQARRMLRTLGQKLSQH
jgi:transcriptional regulator with XRE-family HTH domain